MPTANPGYNPPITTAGDDAAVFDVRDYGADPSGASDSRTAFINAQLAMSVFPSLTGYKLHIPTGTYRISNYVPILKRGLLVYGDGLANTVVQVDNGKTGFIFKHFAEVLDGFEGAADGATLRDVTVRRLTGSLGGTYPTWPADTAVTVGHIYVPTYMPALLEGAGYTRYSWAYRVKAVVGNAKTGVAEPAWHNVDPRTTPSPGDITDNNVTWEPIQAHAVDIRATGVSVEKVFIDSFQCNGININCNVLGWSMNGNLWRVSKTVAIGCGGHGLFARGGDANAGSCQESAFQSNRGWGVYDVADASNDYTAVHTESNECGSVYTTSANLNNVYSELGQPPITLRGGACWRRGTPASTAIASFSGRYATVPTTWAPDTVTVLGAVVRPTVPNGWVYRCSALTGDAKTGLVEPTWSKGFAWLNHDDTTNPKRVIDDAVTWIALSIDEFSDGMIDLQTNSNSARDFVSNASGKTMYFRAGVSNSGDLDTFGWHGDATVDGASEYIVRWNESEKAWMFNHGNAGNGNAIGFTGSGHGRGAARALFPRGFIFNQTTGAMDFGTQIGPPAGVAHVVGDRFWYPPTAGGKAGSVCVTAGSPGTWKDFGDIDP